jgi:hypothetical protein
LGASDRIFAFPDTAYAAGCLAGSLTMGLKFKKQVFCAGALSEIGRCMIRAMLHHESVYKERALRYDFWYVKGR